MFLAGHKGLLHVRLTSLALNYLLLISKRCSLTEWRLFLFSEFGFQEINLILSLLTCLIWAFCSFLKLWQLLRECILLELHLLFQFFNLQLEILLQRRTNFGNYPFLVKMVTLVLKETGSWTWLHIRLFISNKFTLLGIQREVCSLTWYKAWRKTWELCRSFWHHLYINLIWNPKERIVKSATKMTWFLLMRFNLFEWVYICVIWQVFVVHNLFVCFLNFFVFTSFARLFSSELFL